MYYQHLLLYMLLYTITLIENLLFCGTIEANINVHIDQRHFFTCSLANCADVVYF